jgi:PhzF family phenazine biosynthesis protein
MVINMKRYIVYQIDSFTKELFKGNPAGVVMNADGLSEAQMQMIARELNNSETSFLFSSDGKDCDGVIRYFTPKTEVPICGHATVAAMYAKAVAENLAPSVYRMRTKIGVLPFEIIKTHNDYKVVMTQGKIEVGAAFEGELKEKILKGLDLNENDLNEECPIQIVSTGHSKVMVGIKKRERLNQLSPKFTELAELSRIINCNGYFVFTLDSDSKDILTYGRMFAPAVGIIEDPVTGNAHGPLGAYLVHHGFVDTSKGGFSFKGKQGEAINRLGTIEVKVKIEDNQPTLVQIAGEAVIVFKTEIEI